LADAHRRGLTTPGGATPGAPAGQAYWDNLLNPESGGGDSWGSSRAASEYEAQIRAQESQKEYERQLEIMRQQQAFEIEQQRLKAEAEKKARLEALQQERLQVFTSLMGNDPVRAVLYALGVGGETTGLPTQRFAELAPMQGAQQKKTETEKALTDTYSKYGTKTQGNIKLSGEGVSGLSSPEQMSRAVMQGDENVLKLLSSAYGVGNKQTSGISGQELQRRAQEVTPMGILSY
jgi:hypothetical protein